MITKVVGSDRNSYLVFNICTTVHVIEIMFQYWVIFEKNVKEIISKSKVGKERKSISKAKQKCGLCVREQTGNTFLPFKHIHTHTLSGISCCGLIAWYIFLLFPSSPVRTELHQAVHNRGFHQFSVRSSAIFTLLFIISDLKRYGQVFYLMKSI